MGNWRAMMPNLKEIAGRSGLAERRLRYVLDQGLLPGGAIRSRGRGAVRVFEPFEAFGLVMAALLLEAGLSRASVRGCLGALVAGPDPASMPLHRAYVARGPTRLEIGDGRHVRVVVEGGPEAGRSSTAWLPVGGAPEPAGSYRPLVTIALDVSQIRERLGRPG